MVTNTESLDFTLKGKGCTLNLYNVRDALKLPGNKSDNYPSKTEVRTMLEAVNCASFDSNLGKIIRKELRR